MRQVILYVNTTLDGYMAGPGGELDWMIPDPVMNEELSNEMRGEVDTILAGRNAYQAFEEHFRQQAADPASPAGLVEFANWMIDTPKVVFSRSLSTLDNPSARLADADIPNAVEALKRSPGKGLVLFGGVSTVQQFVQHGLVDEYWIKVYPFALGNGQPVFTDLVDRARLHLVYSKAYDSGILTLRYQPA